MLSTQRGVLSMHQRRIQLSLSLSSLPLSRTVIRAIFLPGHPHNPYPLQVLLACFYRYLRYRCMVVLMHICRSQPTAKMGINLCLIRSCEVQVDIAVRIARVVQMGMRVRDGEGGSEDVWRVGVHYQC